MGIKNMSTNKQTTNHNSQKRGKQDQKFSKTTKSFYVLMFLLIISSSFIRIAGASRHPQGGATPAPQINSVGSGGTAARVFVFHKGDSSSGMCEDLVIPATGSAVYSNCGSDVEKQYALSNTERGQLQRWIEQFQPVNYDHNDKNQTGNVTTQLYLNGRGSQAASDTDIQSMVQFAETLAAKIAFQP